MKPVQTKGLYREILRAARAFPSIKRDSLVDEVRREFRANMNETDTQILQDQFQIAFKGLEQLSMYVTTVRSQGDWSVQLESNPMPKGYVDEEDEPKAKRDN